MQGNRSQFIGWHLQTFKAERHQPFRSNGQAWCDVAVYAKMARDRFWGAGHVLLLGCLISLTQQFYLLTKGLTYDRNVILDTGV